MKKTLTFVLATMMICIISVGLSLSGDAFAFPSSCKRTNTSITEISLPRGGYYTNIANRVLFMHAIQKEIINLSHHNIYDDQYLQYKYEQIETAFTNLTSAVSEMEALLRETHNEMLNCNVRPRTSLGD